MNDIFRWRIANAEADLTMNETIDANDLLYFSDYWLESGCWHPYWCDGADINGDGTVNFIDFSRLARHWLWESPF